MTHGGARVGAVELAIDDPIKRHGAGARTDQRDQNEGERPPPRPAPVVTRGDGHRGQRERQGKDRVRKPDELGPLANDTKHAVCYRAAGPRRSTANEGDPSRPVQLTLSGVAFPDVGFPPLDSAEVGPRMAQSGRAATKKELTADYADDTDKKSKSAPAESGTHR